MESFPEDEDAFTTNLYLSNLSPHVTEELLCEIFGKFGEINSIKIMWPKRPEDDNSRRRNCGFVSFKKRADASDALVLVSVFFPFHPPPPPPSSLIDRAQRRPPL
jgi:RNA recognition motif-containing protein